MKSKCVLAKGPRAGARDTSLMMEVVLGAVRPRHAARSLMIDADHYWGALTWLQRNTGRVRSYGRSLVKHVLSPPNGSMAGVCFIGCLEPAHHAHARQLGVGHTDDQLTSWVAGHSPHATARLR